MKLSINQWREENCQPGEAWSLSAIAPCGTGILGGTGCTTGAVTGCTITTSSGIISTAIRSSGLLYSHLDSRLAFHLQVVDSSTRYLSRNCNPSNQLGIVVLLLFLLTCFLAQSPGSQFQLIFSPPVASSSFCPQAQKILKSNNLRANCGWTRGLSKNSNPPLAGQSSRPEKLVLSVKNVPSSEKSQVYNGFNFNQETSLKKQILPQNQAVPLLLLLKSSQASVKSLVEILLLLECISQGMEIIKCSGFCTDWQSAAIYTWVQRRDSWKDSLTLVHCHFPCRSAI